MFLGLVSSNPEIAYNTLAQAKGHSVSIKRKRFCGWNKNIIKSGKYFYAFSHIPYHKLNLPDSCFTVTVFRDPVARVFSHYKMLRTYEQNKINHPCMKAEAPWIGVSFADFVERIPDSHCLNQLFMFSSKYDPEEAVENIRNVSVAFTGESFDAGVSAINRARNLRLVPIHIRKTEIEEEVDEKVWQRLKERLQLEYEMFKLLKSEKVLVS